MIDHTALNDIVSTTAGRNPCLVVVSLSYSDERLMRLEDGLELIRVLSRSVPAEKPSPQDLTRTYGIRFVTAQEIEEAQVTALLGQPAV